MSKRTLVVAPHPDDEILGCGGTLLRRKAEGVEIAWLIVTGISEQAGWSKDKVQQRNKIISKVAQIIDFNHVYDLRLAPAQLDTLPMDNLIKKISSVFHTFQPNEVFIPHVSDVHTDHRVVFDAIAACTKWFRYPFVQHVLAYETLSETEFSLNPDSNFRANYFVNIAAYLEKKMEVMLLYEAELDVYPFPRSLEAIRALAILRGSASGYTAAEAFQMLRARQ